MNNVFSQAVVIKVGGRRLAEKTGRNRIIRDIISLSASAPVVVVHGGKFQINRDSTAKLPEKKPVFIKGQRFTDEDTLKQVTETLGRINKEFVREFNSVKNNVAVGICGADSGMIEVKRDESLGYVGRIKSVDSKLVGVLVKNRYIPVIFPICADRNSVLNVNADNIASAVAAGIKARTLVFISDVPGILDREGRVIKSINSVTVKRLKKEGVITEGMIPKVDGCFDAIRKGVKEVFITDRIVVRNRKLAPAGTRISA